MANPIQQLTLRRELADAAAARRRRKSEVDGDDDALFMSACPGPVRLLKDLARLLWMYVTFFGFLTGGGLIFQTLEHPLEIQMLDETRARLNEERDLFMRFVFNGSWNSVTHRYNIDQRLIEYEKMVAVAAEAGLDLSTSGIDGAHKEPTYQWTYSQAVFFTFTTLAMIGYGNIAPVSTAGRVFCILFSIVGIPFTLSVIINVGQIFATIVSAVWRRHKNVIKPVMKRVQSWVDERQKRQRRWRRRKRRLLEQVGGGGGAEEISSDEDDEQQNDDEDDDGPVEVGFRQNLLTAFMALVALTVFLTVAALVFKIWEREWTFLDAFYFSFVTMTTVGFGDMVPNIELSQPYLIVCNFYILIGLAFTSTIIELVRRQYNESWCKIQELRAQIQMQIKLAATMRQLAANNVDLEGMGMDLNADMEALKANIAKFKKGKWGQGFADFDMGDLDWIDGNKKVKAVTILIYETSV